MDTFKVKHFEDTHPGETFPPFQAVHAKDAHRFRELLRARLQLDATADDLALVNALGKVEMRMDSANAQDDGFSLREVFNAIEIESCEQLYINWYRFDQIDQIRADDVMRCFDDIWYPASDDIDIFDHSLSWVVSISHEGSIAFVKFHESS